MKNGKAVFPYNIPVYLLKILSEYIAVPLCDIINESFSGGVFPDLGRLRSDLLNPKFGSKNQLFCD